MKEKVRGRGVGQQTVAEQLQEAWRHKELRLKLKDIVCVSVSLSHTHVLVRPLYPEPNVSPNRGKSVIRATPKRLLSDAHW